MISPQEPASASISAPPTGGSPPWDTFVREHFPGYVLPASARSHLSVEEAARFLSRLTGRPHELALLRAVSTLSPRVESLRRFAFATLPDLVRTLPSKAQITRREWEGGFQGRLEIPATRALWAAGQRTRFVTRTRARTFALPENALVRAVAGRLLQTLVDLRQAGVMSAAGWGADILDCEGQLRHALGSTVLREVPEEAIDSAHEQAAHAGKHPGYGAALDWHRAMQEGMDRRDPAVIAQVLSRGALAPLDAPARFELAVVIRLVMALWEWLERAEPTAWTFEHCLIRPGRRELVAFERADGARVRVFYNQSHLDAGPCDSGARHYFGHTGRMRPDATIEIETGTFRSAAVIEIKLTERSSYVLEGYHEAMLYRTEYAEHLHGWPKAMLVTSAHVKGPVREQDEVVAVGWRDWVPGGIVASLLSPLGR